MEIKIEILKSLKKELNTMIKIFQHKIQKYN